MPSSIFSDPNPTGLTPAVPPPAVTLPGTTKPQYPAGSRDAFQQAASGAPLPQNVIPDNEITQLYSHPTTEGFKDALGRGIVRPYGGSGIVLPSPPATPTPAKPETPATAAPASKAATKPHVHGTFNYDALNDLNPQAQGTSSPPDKGFDWGGLAKFLGDAGMAGLNGAKGLAGGLLQTVSRAGSAGGGDMEHNPYYVQNKQNFEQALQQNEIQNQQIQQLRDIQRAYGLQTQALTGQYGPSGNALGYNKEMLPYSAGVDVSKYGGMLQQYLKNFPQLAKLYQSLYGGTPFTQTAASAWAQNPDYNALIAPGGVGSTAVNPQSDVGTQMANIARAQAMMGSMPRP